MKKQYSAQPEINPTVTKKLKTFVPYILRFLTYNDSLSVLLILQSRPKTFCIFFYITRLHCSLEPLL